MSMEMLALSILGLPMALSLLRWMIEPESSEAVQAVIEKPAERYMTIGPFYGLDSFNEACNGWREAGWKMTHSWTDMEKMIVLPTRFYYFASFERIEPKP